MVKPEFMSVRIHVSYVLSVCYPFIYYSKSDGT